MKKIFVAIFCVVSYCFGIPYVQGNGYSINGSSDSSTKLGFASNVTENNMILVVGYFYEPTAVTVTDNLSHTYTLIDTITSGQGLRIGLWYTDSISAGADTITMTYTSACSYRKMVILEYTGYSILSAHDISNRSGTSGTIIGDTITTSTADELVFSYIGIGNGVLDVTPYGGYVFRDSATSPNNTFGVQTCDSVLSSAGDIRNIYTLSTTANNPMGIASFKKMGLSCTAPTITAFATSICTTGVAFSKTNTVANADSVTFASLPAGLTGTKTGANIGKISGTPTTVTSKAGYMVIAWGCTESSKDTAYDTLTVIDTTTCTLTKGTKKWTTCDAEYATVREACDSATYRDTVLIAADTAIWDEALILDKGIVLMGAASGTTQINSNITDQDHAVIFYDPDNPENNVPFRVSRISINCKSMSNGIRINNYRNGYFIDSIRIDHCVIDSPGGLNAGMAIAIQGDVTGCIDNNTINAANKKSLEFGGSDSVSWALGTDGVMGHKNLYAEDNIINSTDTRVASGQGGRYALRYNTVRGATASISPTFDAHGNMPGGNYSAMGTLIYGMDVDSGTNYDGNLFDHRGAQAVVFGNRTYGSFQQTIRKEYADSILGGNFLMRQHSTYYWNNRTNGNLIAANITDSFDFGGDIGYVPKRNRDFFNQYSAAFTGDSGIGVGPIANITETCDSGVGYWATNQYTDTLSLSSVGASPTEPLNGILYTAVADNTWMRYFIPYEYPHPLRYETTPMSVTSVSPASSSLTGTNDTISGTGFGTTQGYVVYTASGTDYHAASYVSWVDEEIVVTTPTLSDGAYTVLVVNANSQVDSSQTFTKNSVGPLSFSPYAGPAMRCRVGVVFLDSLKNAGAAWDSATVSPSLPSGIVLNKTTGVVTGTAIARSYSTLYRFYGWGNGAKEDSTDLSIRFYKPEITSP